MLTHYGILSKKNTIGIKALAKKNQMRPTKLVIAFAPCELESIVELVHLVSKCHKKATEPG